MVDFPAPGSGIDSRRLVSTLECETKPCTSATAYNVTSVERTVFTVHSRKAGLLLVLWSLTFHLLTSECMMYDRMYVLCSLW